ncbi:MAG TPA: amino acid adenylation domain-containing protein, partial [Pyrinomonadaceae bacterium]|nr:amino acid adenylation domain-containing protein [Pyrinomonadaceae bacterium]
MQANVESVYPLSPMQEGMLFHTLYAPESGVYFVQTVYPMRQRLNVAAFGRAWQCVVDRHAALRTSFVWEDLKKPVQVVERRLKVCLTELDWRGLPADERERRLQEFLIEDRARGFDLSAPPLMRLTLIREGEDAYKFVWSWHHLLMDGWSSSLVAKEARSFYEALCEGHEPTPGPVRPFQHYVAWLKRQDPAAAESYWRRTLKGFTSPTRVGLMSPRGKSEEVGKRYGQEHLKLSAESSAALQAAAVRRRLTLNTLAQGAWAILLGRHGGSADVLFGAVVSGRPAELPGVEAMVGLFINTLPVRVRVEEGAGVWAWLKALQGEQAEARRYEYTPLVQAQGWGEVPRGVDLFETLLVFENYSAKKSAAAGGGGGEEAERVRSYEQVNYPLTVVVVPGPRLTVEVNYDCARLDASGARQLLSHYARLLESLARAGDSARVSELEMMAEPERRQLLSGWNETKAEYPDTACLHELFEEQAARTPEATALVFEDEELSYEELNRRSNRLAHYLRRSGVGPEVRVGILMERSAEMVVAVLGTLKAGGAYVPLDPSYPRDRLSFMLEDSRVPVLLTHSAAVSSLPPCPARLLLLDELSEVLPGESGENPRREVLPDNLAYVIYTSGSTGRPKGVLIQHRGLCNLARLQARTFGLGPADRVLQFASLSFDASIFEFTKALCVGASLHLAPRERLLPGEGLERLLAERGITSVTLPPTAAEVLEPERAAGLRVLVVAGEACRPELARRWADGRDFYNGYGPTEATVCASLHPIRGDEEGRVPIGRPVSNTRLYVLDSQLRPAPVGATGELHIGGVGLARGYLNRPALTAERFIPDPFGTEAGARLYRTGDLARYLPGGEIEFIGRGDGQIK